MDGYYTKEQASGILSVSVRTISQYLADGRLRAIQKSTGGVGGRRKWIPKADVERLYSEIVSTLPDGPEDQALLAERLAELEKKVDVLMLSIGSAGGRKPRTEAELLVLRQQMQEHNGRSEWKTHIMLKAADATSTLQDVELKMLVEKMGPTAWTPFSDALGKMMRRVERDESFPGGGLDIVHARLGKAKDRLAALLFTEASTATPAERKRAAAAYDQTQIKPTMIESYILNYISAGW